MLAEWLCEPGFSPKMSPITLLMWDIFESPIKSLMSTHNIYTSRGSGSRFSRTDTTYNIHTSRGSGLRFSRTDTIHNIHTSRSNSPRFSRTNTTHNIHTSHGSSPNSAPQTQPTIFIRYMIEVLSSLWYHK